ncbi:MAG: Hpt domain-containing protein, partial [Simplicispira sp.]|nr:Hpt domain-containing protein [Simplicispira sp.]
VPAPLFEIDDELLQVFLEEVREVVSNGLAAMDALEDNPGELSEQTTLRRAFHTLKGSSRMVGLNDFGEAAWAMEQLLNAWLVEQKPMPPALLQLAQRALHGLSQWADDIADGDASAWQSAVFSRAADAMRLHGTELPLVLPGVLPAPTGFLAEPPAQERAPERDLSPEVLAVPAMADEVDFSEFSAALAAQSPVQEPDDGTGVQATDPLPGPLEFAQVSDGAGGEILSAEPSPDQDALLEFFELDLSQMVPAEAPGGAPADALAQAVADDGGRTLVPEELVEAARDFETAQATEAIEFTSAADADEAVKVIGSLRIGIPLYNVYLNEADEWSRLLVTSLQEWSLQLHRPLPDTAVALAHSLAGSSATVGFKALSETSRLLEHALNHVQLQPQGLPEQAAVFIAAAEDIRRLLHQFAAGFLKEANPLLLEQLRQILDAEVAITLSPSLEYVDDPFAAEWVPQPERLQAPLEAVPVEAPALVPPASFVAPAPSVLPSFAAGPAPVLNDAVAVPAAAAAVPNVDDDIDVLDVIDPDLFQFFEEEAVELLPRLGGALRQWTARPENLGARSEVLRALHTLKGSARLAGAMRLGEMSHRLESSIEELDAETVQTAQLEPLLGRFDDLQANFDVLRGLHAQGLAAPVVVQPIAPIPAPAPLDEEAMAPTSDALAQPAMAPVPAPVPVPAALPLVPAVPLRATASQSVRVRAQLLDRLINQSGEVLITRSRMQARMGQIKGSMADLSGNLDRLRQHLRDIELQSESQMQSRLALSKDTVAAFDPLEFDRFTRVQELTRMMAESVNDVATVQRNLQRAMEGTEDDLIAQGRQARELQRDLLHTRMVEFEGIAERLYAVVRQTSKELGKQVKLDITGGSIEMDRGVLDRMTPAFEHLLRNCVSHGIELPHERLAAGKPAVGAITIGLRHEGNDVSVAFTDDGAGLNLARIRAKALSQGLIAPDAVIDDAQAAHLIFMPGFTTATEVTGLSGRGVGMDVVRSEINALGGRIETSSQEGKGMAFRMVLPLTTAVTQVVMLRAGHLCVGVPAHLIEVVRRVPVAELEQAYRTGCFEVGGEQVPFYWSGGLLQASLASSETVGKTRPVVVFRSASQRIALHVDEVLGNQEVVVKNLGPQLSRLPGLSGMSVLASGAVVLIYNPVALSTVYGEQVRAAGKAALAAARETAAQAVSAPALAAPAPAVRLAGQVPLVLVVDDSITVRRVTQRLLQREGYRVVLAADGLQAIERLQEERPTVVLSDIEMPRMDGFDLAHHIRADAKLNALPIIMITSRIAEKHRHHAMELGVNHYLGKPYSDEELLSLVRHYADLEAEKAEV